MSAQTSLAFSFVYLPFLLVPGYITLRGYLNATIQLDTMTRLDKLLTTVVAGCVTLIFMLVLNRFRILAGAVDLWFAVWNSHPIEIEISYMAENANTPERIPELSALTLLGFVAAQSVTGYVGGYLTGTYVHLRSSRPNRSEADLQQPWETAVQ